MTYSTESEVNLQQLTFPIIKEAEVKRLIFFELLGIVLLVIFAVIPLARAATLIVENNSEVVNGDTTSPTALVADAGPDGISLREALLAIIFVSGPHEILFDPSLKGTTISLSNPLPLLPNQATIDGDIDGSGASDITIDGKNSVDNTCFRVLASDISVEGLTILNFSWSGISVFTDSGQGWPSIERVTVRGNTISGSWAGMEFYNWGQNCTLSDIEIVENKIVDNSDLGILISAALGPSNTNNQLINVSITENTISGRAVFAMGATNQGSTNNVVSGLEISNNTINGDLLISAANEQNCQGNMIEDLVIQGNVINGSPVTMEILGGVGWNTGGNAVSNLTITENTLRGGGIQLVGGQGNNAYQNLIDIVLIEKNRISQASANGVFVIAGSSGATNNTVREIKVINNVIFNNSDAGILLHGEGADTPNNTIEDVNIMNNTLVGNGNLAWAGGININTKSGTNMISGVRITNTILWGNAWNDSIRGSVSPDAVGFSIVNDSRFLGHDGNFYSPPKFVDLTNEDLHLTADSPCIDAGTSKDAPRTDVEGNSRPQGRGYDLGAYEFPSGKIIAMPWIPLLLVDE